MDSRRGEYTSESAPFVLVSRTTTPTRVRKISAHTYTFPATFIPKFVVFQHEIACETPPPSLNYTR